MFRTEHARRERCDVQVLAELRNLDAPMLSLWTIGELPGANASLGIRKRSPVPIST